ncbi:MAG: hypothetical protein ACUVSU_01005 [Aggregatilineaceae bacterium]
MGRYSEISITVGALGIVITLIGLFPGIVGLEAAAGVGVLQVLVILLGFSILFSSAFFFARKAFYDGQPATLAQEIGIRLTLTGLLIAGAAGLADVLGFGSHPSTPDSRPFLGRLQAIVFTGGILLASSGVLVYALFGPPSPPDDNEPSSGDDTLPRP